MWLEFASTLFSNKQELKFGRTKSTSKSSGLIDIQSYLPTTATLRTEESGRCGQVSLLLGGRGVT